MGYHKVKIVHTFRTKPWIVQYQATMRMFPSDMLQSHSISSRMLDSFVMLHSVCALSFASAMLFTPWAFGIFMKMKPSPYAMDAIRWACPFVYGYGILAFTSLSMPPYERFKVACIYSLTLGMAVPVGCFVQASGRWNDWHLLNILLFAWLSAAYALFISKFPHAFDREQISDQEDDYQMYQSRIWMLSSDVLRGHSISSRMLDSFVMMHSVCALSFASAMLFAPWAFGIFMTADEAPPYATDAIRWACPFVYGYGILAFISLSMPPYERFKVACIYSLTLGMAVPVGFFVQASGRWNDWHLLNILLFASLSASYAWFIVKCPRAFDRKKRSNLLQAYSDVAIGA